MSRSLRDLLLLAALVGLSVLFVDAIRGGNGPALPVTKVSPPPAAPVEEPMLPEVEPAPLERLTEALQRPLFFQSRRPPAPPAAVPRPLDATLAGVLTTESEKVAIVMTSGSSGRASRLREGDVFRGWQVVRIDDQSVELERDGRIERLALSFTRPAEGEAEEPETAPESE